jgi:quinol---cytochrome-c reductase cytochrome c subunit
MSPLVGPPGSTRLLAKEIAIAAGDETRVFSGTTGGRQAPKSPAERIRRMRALSARSSRALLGWALIAVAGVAAVGWSSNATAAESGQEAEEGARLYALHCAQCHGSDGGGGPMPRFEGEAPSLLPEENEDLTVAYVDLVMATGRMPPAGSPYDNRQRRVVLDEGERAAIVEWMQQEFGIPGELPEVGEGDAARGQAVWTTNCAHCHGAIGQGGVAGAGAWTPAVIGSSPQVIAEAIRVGPFQMPGFSQSQISDQEVADIAAFIQEVEEEEGTPILGLVELNPVFASAFVALLALLTLLSLVWIGGRPAWFPDQPREEIEPEVPAGAARRTEPTEDEA